MWCYIRYKLFIRQCRLHKLVSHRASVQQSTALSAPVVAGRVFPGFFGPLAWVPKAETAKLGHILSAHIGFPRTPPQRVASLTTPILSTPQY